MSNDKPLSDQELEDIFYATYGIDKNNELDILLIESHKRVFEAAKASIGIIGLYDYINHITLQITKMSWENDSFIEKIGELNTIIRNMSDDLAKSKFYSIDYELKSGNTTLH